MDTVRHVRSDRLGNRKYLCANSKVGGFINLSAALTENYKLIMGMECCNVSHNLYHHLTSASLATATTLLGTTMPRTRVGEVICVVFSADNRAGGNNGIGGDGEIIMSFALTFPHPNLAAATLALTT